MVLIRVDSVRQRRRYKTNYEIVKQSLRVIIIKYCKESSIGGLKYLVDDETSFFERVVWYITVIGALMCSASLVWITFQKYYSSPLVTTQLPEGVSVHNVVFPAIGICSINRISKKAVTILAKELLQEERNSKYTESEMLKILFALGQFYDLQPQNDDYLEELHQVLGQYDVRELLKRLTPRCEDLILRCMWNEEIRNCTELLDFRLTANGYCCCFNYIRYSDTEFADMIIHEIYPTKSFNTGNKSSFGFDQGLKMLLRLDDTDDFYSNLQLQGAQLQFSDAFDFPDAPSGSFALQIISPNVDMTVSMTTSITEASREIQHIPLNLRKCLFSDESPYLSYYTYSDCLLKCRLEFLASVCNCTPFNMLKRRDVRVCKVRDILCVRKYYAQSITIDIHDDEVLPEIEVQLTGGSIFCPMCYPTCSKVHYMYEFTNVRLYADYLNSVPDEDRQDWLKGINYSDTSVVHVKHGTGTATSYGQNIIMKWFDLFSNIGSTCGFVMGFSFVSILEFIYFFTIKLARELKRQRKSNEVGTKPVKTVTAALAFPIMRYRPIYWNELNRGIRTIRFPEID